MWKDTRHPSTGHGWLLHGLETPGQTTIEHAELACDEEFVRFLIARLGEEMCAAVRRQRTRRGATQRTFAGQQVLHELVDALEQGRLPDDVSLDLVISVYAAHPDFQPRWRHPAALMPTITPLTTRSA